MLPFPFSLVLLPLSVAAGVGYVTLGRVTSAGVRRAGRAAVLGATWVSPLLTRGPGPAQLVLGVLVGFLGIRMAALGARVRPGRAGPGAVVIAWRMLLPAPLLVRRAVALPRQAWEIVRGLLASALCVGLLVAGNADRLWHRSWFVVVLLVFVVVVFG